MVKNTSKILGISAYYHDSAAALIDNGDIIAAAQEERFTRKKHDPSFPINAIKYVIEEGGIALSDIAHVVFYDKPFLKFERLLETYLANAPCGRKSFSMAMPVWIREKLFLKTTLTKNLKKIDSGFTDKKLRFCEHHFSHAASAFYPSPFDEAIVLTLDGVGEWATTSVVIGEKNKMKVVKELNFPHSLGLFYSAFTYYTGFRVNSGEYKLMGLAPYGNPKYVDIILKELIDLKNDGSFKLNQKYFNYSTGLTMTNNKFSELFGMPVRKPDIDKLTQFHMDIAASIQAVTEKVILLIAKSLSNEFNLPNLCLAGGVALNCVANGKILKSNFFKDIWIQPAAGDAGGALGSALAYFYHELNNDRVINANDSMKGSYLGPSYSQNKIENELNELGAAFEVLSEDHIIDKTSSAIIDGLAVGWFQDRMEYGPRALGNRSIIGDARSDKMQKLLNLKVKYRESFRPFAPSVLFEDVNEWFDMNQKSPYMLIVANVLERRRKNMTGNEKNLFGIEKLNVVRSEVPAITHVDYSARVQTVHKDTNPKYHNLISNFKEKTGCSVIVNTSFNVRGEPIVRTPTDAFKCFMGTELDVLIINNCILYKNNQKSSLAEDYKNKYNLD